MNRAPNISLRWTGAALLSLCTALPAVAEPPLTWPDAQVRLGIANQVARQRADAQATAKVKDCARRAKDLIAHGRSAAAERCIRDAETAAGLDPGGRSMAGLPIYHPTAAMADQVNRLRDALDQALRAANRDATRQVIRQMRQVLGDQAGVPETLCPGRRDAPRGAIAQRQAVELFLAALDQDKAQLSLVASGRPVGDNFVRFYAELVAACCEIRPAIQAHRPDQLPHLDQLVAGACFLMTALQQPPGHMPFPDPKNKDTKGQARWVVSVADDGGSQFDTGEAGAALLQAGVTYANADWTTAGLKAADWAIAQPCVHNFTYNAISVYLLAEAFRATKNRKYLDAALAKWDLGLAPAQVDNGRWIDPHNARTAYHVIILRGIATLALVCPDDYADRRDVLKESTAAGVKSLLDEFDRLGVTNTGYALPVLLSEQKLNPAADSRLQAAIDRTAAAILASCIRDGKPCMGASPPAVAALARLARD
ncbi:MAG TPA: hypothetical protein VH475_07305 [Tepidisphaeraceae bacterium]